MGLLLIAGLRMGVQMGTKKGLGAGSLRRVQIDKDNTYIFVAVASAAACLIFSLVATQALWKQAGYNNRVKKEMETTRNILRTNLSNLESLESSYKAFVEQPTNIIGGSSTGTGDRDGDNAKITLDAMPSVYDYPGMVTGFNKVLNTHEFGDVAITATDDEIAQKANTTPQAVEIPVSFSGSGDFNAAQAFLKRLNNMIRPIKVSSLAFSGSSEGNITVSVQASTNYQPKKHFQVTTKEVK